MGQSPQDERIGEPPASPPRSCICPSIAMPGVMVKSRLYRYQ